MRGKIERLFAEVKDQMGLRRARMRGEEKVTEQCLLASMAQNIKRIVKTLKNPRIPPPFLHSFVRTLDFFSGYFILNKLF